MMTKEERKDYDKKYYKNNADKKKEYTKKYYRDNMLKIKDYHKEYRKNNPDKVNASDAKRRAVKTSATPENANQNIINTFYEMSARLTVCIGIKYHVDHLVPLSKGGKHHEENLLPVPASVNLTKNGSLDFSHPFYSHINLNQRIQ